jgi:hypothetical protein
MHFEIEECIRQDLPSLQGLLRTGRAVVPLHEATGYNKSKEFRGNPGHVLAPLFFAIVPTSQCIIAASKAMIAPWVVNAIHFAIKKGEVR